MIMTLGTNIALTLVALFISSPAQVKEKKPVDPNKKVCRSEIPTGSMMRKSTCHTLADWAQIDAVNAAAAQSMHDQTSRSGSPQ